jgi:pyruvate,orthophosphate dikinase
MISIRNPSTHGIRRPETLGLAGYCADVDLLLHVLRIKGRATPETLEEALDIDATAAVERLAAQGLVETTRTGYRVTAAGNERIEELYAHEREKAGVLIEDVYEAFLPINDEVKQIVTDWQCVTVDGQLVLNDHLDRAHDDDVIARLHRTDARITGALAPLTAVLPRLEIYPARLRRAITRIDDGDGSMVAAPIKDSYHTVWFELHEELLVLSGRPRTE